MRIGLLLFCVLLTGCAGMLRDGAIINVYSAYDDGEYKEVISKVDRTLNQYEFSDATTSRLLFLKAESHFKLKDYSNAFAVYSYIVKLHPKTEAAYKASARLPLFKHTSPAHKKKNQTKALIKI
jgi:outer membrane protein assembly factor BamD (BamD/ComL family)